MKNPFQYSDTNKRYHTFDYMIRHRIGRKCVKIPLDIGLTCPNKGGCTYCSLERREDRCAFTPIANQYKEQTSKLGDKWAGAAFLPYFQNYSNTNADLKELKPLFEEALLLPDACGIDIATRCDCLDDEKIEYLKQLSKEHFVILELGLQTIHDKTAKRINRGHSYEDFLRVYEKLEGINVCIHIINSLPGETEEMMLETAKEIGRLHPFMLKIHMLYIEEGTPIAKEYTRGDFELISLEDYARICVKQLEHLPPDICIGRITGDGVANSLIAPLWSKKKLCVMNEIDKLQAKNNTFQGILCK